MVKKKQVILNYKGEKLNLELKEMKWSFQKAMGLMFCRREKAKALLFSFKNPVALAFHSFFVFFDFLAIWLDEKNKIIEIKRIKPWKLDIKIGERFTKLIEIPINDKYKKIITLLDED